LKRQKKLKLDLFLEEDNFIGPVINKRQFDKILNYIDIGKEKEKLHLETGGRKLLDKGYFIEPTIFSRVPDTSQLAREEIFGPILVALTPFKDAKEAVDRCNNTKYGLGAAVFTNNMNISEYFVRNVISGTVWVNMYNYTFYNVPFGGFKQSGFGRDNGYEAVAEYSTVKAVYYKHDLSKF